MGSQTTKVHSVIVGLGATGLSCARYLKAQGESFQVVDSREEPPGLAEFQKQFPDAELTCGSFAPQILLKARRLIVSPGVSLKTPEIMQAAAAGVTITGDVDIFSQAVRAPVLAITGSNGKSTVAVLVAEILRAAGKKVELGGNLEAGLGEPALDLLGRSEADFYVLELSSFQLETTQRLQAEVVTILNLSADHMDRYSDLQAYQQAKQRIFYGARQVVVNTDDALTAYHGDENPQLWQFGLGKPGVNGVGLIEEDGEQFLSYRLEKIMPVSELKIVGQHNIANALAASAMALAAGIGIADLRRGLAGFTGLPHRCQFVAAIDGVDYFNDSKGTNVGASVAAIEGLGSRIAGHLVLIAGGIGKGADFSALSPALNRWAKKVILIGQDAGEIAASLDAQMPVQFAGNLQEAVALAKEAAQAGDAVLLSPACASFDMFRNFQERGKAFVKAVEKLQ